MTLPGSVAVYDAAKLRWQIADLEVAADALWSAEKNPAMREALMEASVALGNARQLADARLTELGSGPEDPRVWEARAMLDAEDGRS